MKRLITACAIAVLAAAAAPAMASPGARSTIGHPPRHSHAASRRCRRLPRTAMVCWLPLASTSNIP